MDVPGWIMVGDVAVNMRLVAEIDFTMVAREKGNEPEPCAVVCYAVTEGNPDEQYSMHRKFFGKDLKVIRDFLSSGCTKLR